MYSDLDRVTALAGIYQAATLAQQIARRGMADSDAMEASVFSLFQVDAESVPAVFGGRKGVAAGLRQLHAHLGGDAARDLELTRHVVALMQLERKLSRSPDKLQHIRRALATAKQRLEHFSMLHNNILAQIAELYVEVVSPMQPRIIVRGEALHLQNPDNQNKIRTLLLAGIRAAMLWRQIGGRRKQLLLSRRRIGGLAQQLYRGLGVEEAPPAE